jgi:hypothetical protein
MTTLVKAVEILTTLTEDPHVIIFPWQLDVHDTAPEWQRTFIAMGFYPKF